MIFRERNKRLNSFLEREIKGRFKNFLEREKEIKRF